MGTLDVVVLGELGENAGDLRRELLQTKSALLYGDRVAIKSHKVPLLLGGMAKISRIAARDAFQDGLDPSLVDGLIARLEDEGLADNPLGKLFIQALRDEDPSTALEFPEMLIEMLRAAGPVDGELYFRETIVTAAESYLQAFKHEEQDDQLRALRELVHLNESGIVKIDTADAQEVMWSELADLDQVFNRTIEKAVETFEAQPRDHPLLTSGRLTIGHGCGTPGDALEMAHANRVQLAASILADIPSFPTASVDEILDIRKRVTPQLGRFRAAVADLEMELDANVDDDHFSEEVEDLKLRRITPELEELNESLRDEGLGQTASRSAPYLATGVLGLGASVAIGAPELASAVAFSAGATTAVAKEIVERAKLDRQRKKHRMFLLFDVERQLSARSRSTPAG